MDWKHETIEKLKEYTVRKNAVVSIPEEITRLEEAVYGLRAVSADVVSGSGGENTQEDKLLSNIVHRQELERRFADTQIWLATMDRALDLLDREDRLILERFYIHPAKGNVDRLCEELAIEKAGIYKRKDKALRRLTIAIYGITES